MKNLIYFHGIHGNTNQTIAPWLESQMQNYGIQVFYPICFNNGEAFFKNFEHIANNLRENNIFTEESLLSLTASQIHLSSN